MANETLIPDKDDVFTLEQGSSPAEVTLRSREWAVITQVDGHKSVADVARILALGNDEAAQIFAGLQEKGLINKLRSKKKDRRIVPEKFFKWLQKELTRFVGPVAPYLLEDTIYDLGIKKDDCDIEHLPILIETLSDEIKDDGKRLQFQETMLNNYKELSKS